MEVSQREQKEESLAAALQAVWERWSLAVDPVLMTQAALIQLLRDNCLDPLFSVWRSAHLNLLEENQSRSRDSQWSGAFMAFFLAWAKDVSSRWEQRVRSYQSEYRSQQATGKNTFPLVGQEHVSTILSQGQLPPWPHAKEVLLTPEDFLRESVTTVTQSHSVAEQDAAIAVQRDGPILIPIWRTEPLACNVCEKLEGTRPNIWRVQAPQGPPMHPNCRCWLQWVRWEDLGGI
jgi:hypothetical protein